MAHADPVPSASLPVGDQAAPAISRWVALALLTLLLGFILLKGRVIWAEFEALRREWTLARQSTVIGYPGITMRPSYAARPKTWIYDEGDSTLLWSGWQPGVGHRWFRVGRGDVEASQVSRPIGRDVFQAIDRPVVEVGGGERWDLIPWDTPMTVLTTGGSSSVYPLLLMRKVIVVNDEVDRRPLLVTLLPSSTGEASVGVYDPVVDGRRLSLGLSGYIFERKMMLYDRATESLWVEKDKAIEAVAGPLKGRRLPRVGQGQAVSWGDWRDQHPQSRLVVGADRSLGIPAQ